MLVARFRRVEWRTDTPDVHARVISLLLELSRNPLRTKYTHIDAMAALGEDDLGTNDDDGASDRDQASDRDEPDVDVDDAPSDSTLSDWTDDEKQDGDDDDDDARAERLRLGVEEAIAARRDAPRRGERVRGRRSGAPADGTDEDDDEDDDGDNGDGDGDEAATDPEFRWSDLRVDDEPACAAPDRDEWEWDPRETRGRSRGRRGAVVAAAARLLPALASARGRGARRSWARGTDPPSRRWLATRCTRWGGGAREEGAGRGDTAPVARRARRRFGARGGRGGHAGPGGARGERGARDARARGGGYVGGAREEARRWPPSDARVRRFRSHDSRVRRGSRAARSRAAGGAGAPRAEGGGARSV